FPLLAFLSVWAFPEGNYGIFSVGGYEIVFGRVDRLSMGFGTIFSIIAVAGMIFALHVKRKGEHMAAFVYGGGALGAVFAGDLLSLFVFWEIMAFSSVFLIWYGGEKSAAPGMRYLLFHTFGGVCLLGGICIYGAQTGSFAFNAIPASGLGGGLILLGFLVNVAAPPLHTWLPDGYPEATIPGTVFMSSYTTKTAVYVLARGFAGTELLIWIGVLMAVYGVVYAMLENNIRRLLSYHIVSQVGYMVVGIGIGSELAVNGAVAHAFNNIFFKGLMLMGTGSVIYMTGKRKGTELGGLYRTMPLTFILYMIGGFSISGLPLLNGFISKAMVISGAGEAHLPLVFLILILASSGSFLSTTLKLPYAVFLGKDKGIPAKDPPKHMLLGMALAAAACILLGVFPNLQYSLLPYDVDYHAFTLEHLVSQFQIMALTLLGFILFLYKLHPEDTISLDVDWFYRKAAPGLMWLAHKPIARYEGFITEVYKKGLIEPVKKLSRIGWTIDTWVFDGLVNISGWGTLLWSKISEMFDMHVVDGAVNGVPALLGGGAKRLRKIQTGFIQNYVLAMIIGIVVLGLVSFIVIE
ncbi:Na(+)/H(+) antiporter subunit D, partial [Nitrospira defluvii]|nr:Na(+)/H(+) antiporter subunit D [Nitrospira defluvii]